MGMEPAQPYLCSLRKRITRTHAIPYALQMNNSPERGPQLTPPDVSVGVSSFSLPPVLRCANRERRGGGLTQGAKLG